MAMAVREESGVPIVEGAPGAMLIQRAQDATLVLEACFSVPASAALLYPENLTPRFFDLSSGEAGDVLDKFRRYQIRLAIVCRPGTVQFSGRFTEILSDDMRIFETPEAARQWLAGQDRLSSP
ncbi:MAG: DUF4180 domain-containing protein [Vicinamibacterales bacterium]